MPRAGRCWCVLDIQLTRVWAAPMQRWSGGRHNAAKSEKIHGMRLLITEELGVAAISRPTERATADIFKENAGRDDCRN